MTIDLLIATANRLPWTLADEIALDDLPHDVAALVARALALRPRTPDGTSVQSDSLAEAYKRGWEDGVDACKIERPFTPIHTPYNPRPRKEAA